MKIKTIASIVLLLLLLFLVVSDALAMDSTHYALNWYVLLNGSGVGEMSSTHYNVSATIGQTAIGTTTSAGFHSALGFWYGVVQAPTFAPLIVRP